MVFRQIYSGFLLIFFAYSESVTYKMFVIRPGGVPRTLLDMPDVSDCL